jgi:O-antigen ligase
MWVGPSVVRWPRWSLVLLAVAQLGGLAILQVRAMYVGIVLVLVILLLLRETKKLAGLACTLGLGAAALLVMLSAVSLTGIALQGRMGPVDFSFIEQHAKTVLALGDPKARMSHDVDRGGWYQEVWERVRSSPSNLAVGVGFGQVLIDFENEQGIPVRQPHNSSLTVLARLGFVGLSLWLLFIGLVIVRYVRFLRTPYIPAGVSTLVLWLFLQFILTLLDASVQPSLEFSHGAIPFYFLLGLGFATMRSSYDNGDLRRSPVGERQGTGR